METRNKKIAQVNSEYEKCQRIIERALATGNIEKALAGIAVASSLLYSWNQRYMDEFLEESIASIAQSTVTESISKMVPDEETILFYDGFGLDTRGLALIYLNALSKFPKNIYYVTSLKAKGKQPEIDKIIEEEGLIKIYLSSYRYDKKLRELQGIISKIKPGKAFLYTTPNDSAGIAVFMQMKKTLRYIINLTDHAFWLGTQAFDYCLEFRNYGASISNYERKIERQRLILLPYYPSIDKETEFQGWPFEVGDRQIIFSGGMLYKTIDREGTYYKMVSEILKSSEDYIFVYAGSGDDTYLKDLILKYPGQVYHIKERKDLYQVMLHSTIYLNTYPMVGGLMMQYAAAANKIPITLLHGTDQNGILIDQGKRNIEYHTPEELVEDTIKLLENPGYLSEREACLTGSVIGEKEFTDGLNSILCNNRTIYEIALEEPETEELRKEYLDRFDMEKFLLTVATKSNICLLMEYGGIYIKRALSNLLRFRR